MKNYDKQKITKQMGKMKYHDFKQITNGFFIFTELKNLKFGFC